MNKKILGVAISILTLAILVAPVMAGKGQTKQDFKLVFQGLPSGESTVHGNTEIFRDRIFNVYGDMYIEIGSNTIGKEYLEYSATMLSIIHLDDEGETRFTNVKVREMISVYDDETVHDETTLIGTLEILSLGENKVGNGGIFVGQGTDGLKGVKVKGLSEPYELVDDVASPVGFWVQLTRVGAVMGWP